MIFRRASCVASEHEVLLDVSGLGRLIGEPPAIAAAAGARAARRGVAAACVAPTQTAGRLLADRPVCWRAAAARTADRPPRLASLPVDAAAGARDAAAGDEPSRSRAALRDVRAVGDRDARRAGGAAARPICRRGSGGAAWRCSGSRAGSIRGRSCPTARRRAISAASSSNGRSTRSSRCRSCSRGCSSRCRSRSSAPIAARPRSVSICG